MPILEQLSHDIDPSHCHINAFTNKSNSKVRMQKKEKKIAVLISGSGSNLAQLIAEFHKQNSAIKISKVISDRDCTGLMHAQAANIKSSIISRKQDPSAFTDQLIAALDETIDLIVLAGFLSVIPNDLIEKFPNKIINIHPSLLPKHGGAGMYGIKVHQAVIDAQDKVSGCSVHFVTAEVDAGQIIKQAIVKVDAEDSPESLQKKVLAQEHALLKQVIWEMLA